MGTRIPGHGSDIDMMTKSLDLGMKEEPRLCALLHYYGGTWYTQLVG